MCLVLLCHPALLPFPQLRGLWWLLARQAWRVCWPIILMRLPPMPHGCLPAPSPLFQVAGTVLQFM